MSRPAWIRMRSERTTRRADASEERVRSLERSKDGEGVEVRVRDLCALEERRDQQPSTCGASGMIRSVAERARAEAALADGTEVLKDQADCVETGMAAGAALVCAMPRQDLRQRQFAQVDRPPLGRHRPA